MIFFIDESGTRAFNDGDDLMESLGNTRAGINFVMVDGQGTLIGTGSDDKSLMKSMQLIKTPREINPLMKTTPMRKAVARTLTKSSTMQKSEGDFDRIFVKLDELIAY
jgi:hypothetical protein